MADLEPGSPQWWVDRLAKKLTTRRKRYEKLARYAKGDHPLPEGDERARDLFKAFQRKARTNYCGLAVSSVRERLHVVGFRAGANGTTGLDTESWRIWQANHMDADSDLHHDGVLTYSDGYVIVAPNPDDPTTPIISVESPLDVIGERDPRNRRQLQAALKMWADDASRAERAVLYTPEKIFYFERPARRRGSAWLPTDQNWAPLEEVDGVANRTGRVPVVRFVNRPSLSSDYEGMAEFEDAIDIQDRINNGILDRLIISKTQAYRQRWVKGLDLEDENGDPVDLPFIPGTDLLWAVDDDPDKVEFGEFTQVDLTPILKAGEADVTAFVTVTGLPPHYVAGDLVNASADALAAAEARLVARIRSHQRYLGESWEMVLDLAARWADRELPPDTEVIWADPERKTDAQLASAGAQKVTAGVTWRQRMEDMGYSPPTISRMEGERAQDALLAQLYSPLAPSFQQPGQPAVTAGTGAA